MEPGGLQLREVVVAVANQAGILFEVPDDVALEALIRGSLPLRLGTPDAARVFLRDVYYDTPDGLLFKRGMRCRIRYTADGRQVLSAIADQRLGAPEHRADVEITGRDAGRALHDDSPATRLVQAAIEPSRLQPVVDVQTDRYVRRAHWWRWPTACCQLSISRHTVNAAGQTFTTSDLRVTSAGGLGPSAPRVARVLARQHQLRPNMANLVALARARIDTGEVSALATALRSPRECAVLLVRDGEIGFRRHDDHLGVFWIDGSGEAACREVLDQAFGSSQAQVRCLGQVPARPWRRPLEVWMARRLPDVVLSDPSVEWIPMARAVELAGTPVLRDGRTLSTLHVASQSDLMKEHSHGVRPPASMRGSTVPTHLSGESERLLDGDISYLDFNARVLTLASDLSTAIGDRLTYLAIAAANLDEFVMVRIGSLKRAVRKEGEPPHRGDNHPAARLDAVRIRARAQFAAMNDCLVTSLLPALAARGLHIRSWEELGADQQAALARRFQDDIRPRLVPLAITASHPFPHISNIDVAVAAKLRHPDTGQTHYGTVSLPSSLPRMLQIHETGEWIALESIVLAHLESLFPGVDIVDAHVFRVTRSGDVNYDDARSTDQLQQVADAVDQRPFQPVIRLEVDRRMPEGMRALLLQEFRFEWPDQVSDLEDGDVVEIQGLAALRGLREVSRGIASRLPIRARAPFAPDTPVFDTLQRQDVLVYFPYDSFQESVLRMLREACADPTVEAITLTLYRTNDDSPIVDALFHARAAGKTVVALVELKARFDEARNIETAKALRAAGVHVVYGVAGMKLHSKVILVLRREPSGLRRYAFVGSGNLNPVTAALYTDVGLFTADEAIVRDLAALADALTGLSSPPPLNTLLVSPETLLPRLLALIRREIDHARGGRPSGVRAKINGLDDPEMIEALYAASQAGVDVRLSVRGICRLRPGVPGLSDRIQVVSVLGEFLEHARIVEFTNGGSPEYFIGSADWRERNLRRRVEVMVPVRDHASRQRLSYILDMENADRSAWRLDARGTWTRSDADPFVGIQRQLLQALAAET